MRQHSLEQLSPVCPVCRSAEHPASPIAIADVFQETDEHIVQGMLHCTNAVCQREFPIIDGIPLLIRDIRSYLSQNVYQVSKREDLCDPIESLLGDCCGPGSTMDVTRQHLSSYTWDHYAEFDPHETNQQSKPGSVARLLSDGMTLLNDGDQFLSADGPVLDIGCSVGRTSFELAKATGRSVIGIDLNYAMLRKAAEVLRDGRVRYQRRRVGLVYDTRDFRIPFDAASQVDFWACDAAALPFASKTFSMIVSLNTLDCMHSPLELFHSIESALAPGGQALVGCPYDWSTSATPVEQWLGGHSQRGNDSGASEAVVRRLLTPGDPYAVAGLRLIAQRDSDWNVRLHDRSSMQYTSHLVAMAKDAAHSL